LARSYDPNPVVRRRAQEARALLRGVLALDEGSVTRFCRQWGEETEVCLGRCQHVVARELGFENWGHLVRQGGVCQSREK